LLVTDMSDVGINEVRLRMLKGLDISEFNIETIVVKRFNLVHGSFITRLLTDSCDKGDIFIIVLDPRYTDKPRESICIETNSGIFYLGPNNGVLSWVIEDFGIKNCVELPIGKDNVLHPTFNGKYKFSIGVNKLLCGKKLTEIGNKFDKKKVFMNQIPEGTIVHVDNFGNLKIKGDRPKYQLGSDLSINVNGKVYYAKFGREFYDVDEGELIVYPGSSLYGLPEVAINRGSAAEYLKLDIGDKLDIINGRDK